MLASLPGEKNPNTKWRDAQIVEMRRLYVTGVPKVKICAMLDVTMANLNDVVRGKSWSHILGIGGCPTLQELRDEGQRRLRHQSG